MVNRLKKIMADVTTDEELAEAQAKGKKNRAWLKKKLTAGSGKPPGIGAKTFMNVAGIRTPYSPAEKAKIRKAAKTFAKGLPSKKSLKAVTDPYKKFGKTVKGAGKKVLKKGASNLSNSVKFRGGRLVLKLKKRSKK